MNADASPASPSSLADRRRAALCLLVRTAEELMGRMGDRLKSEGLTCSQYQVLCRLAEADASGLPCNHLSDSLYCRDPDLTRLADRLVKAGWVRRERCEADRRVVRLALTPAGRSRVEATNPLVQEVLIEAFSALPDNDLRALEDLLGRLGAGPGAQNELIAESSPKGRM